MFRSFCEVSRSLSFVFLIPSTLAASSGSFSVPGKTSDTRVSSSLNPSFAGFGIEPSNLFSFTGNEGPNNFSINLMQNLADFSGAPPHIRLGGNTQDYMLFNGSFEDYRVMDNPLSVAQGAIAADHMIIGPAYFQALERFPKDTPVTFGLNLAYQGYDWQDKIVDMAQAAIDGMKNVKLYSFEIGNEPDLWIENLFRTAPWTGQTYTDQFFARAETVYKNVLQPAGIPSAFFEPPATASTIGTTFEIKTLVNNGILQEYNGNKYVSTWNQHDYYYFIGVTKEALTLDDLMDLDTTETQFKYWAQQVNIALDTGYNYALREMSCVGPIGMPFVSDTFGAALWTLNFFMYAATLDIESVQMHMTDNSNASAWLPISKYGMDPHVRPAYYAHAAVAQIIGNGNGTTQIGEVDTSKVGGDYSGRIRTYVSFANGDLRSMVLINSKPANASVANKESFTFDLTLPTTFAGQQVYLSYLNAEGSDSLHGTTWNGMTFSDDDGTIGIADDTVGVMTIDDSGKITIPVRDSQAIVANIGWQLGSNPVLPGDGTKIAGTRKSSASGITRTSGAGKAIVVGVLSSVVVFAQVLGWI